MSLKNRELCENSTNLVTLRRKPQMQLLVFSPSFCSMKSAADFSHFFAPNFFCSRIRTKPNGVKTIENLELEQVGVLAQACKYFG
jgi:hypothetical protein